MNSAEDPELKRDIGFFGSTFLCFNGVVGAGIFALPAALYTQFGTFSPWLFPLFGGLILVIAIPFSRLAGYYPGSGGPVVYTRPFGRGIAFQVGWIYYVARAAALAANSNVFITYAASLWAPLGGGIARICAILMLIGGITFINIVGVKRAIRALDALTVLKAAPVVAMALYGLFIFAPSIPVPGPPPTLSEVEVAALLVLYAFIGFENSVVPAGETANPRRTIPRALIATLLATIALYFLVQLSYVAVMERGAGGDAPLVEFGRRLAGPAGGLVLTAAALFSLTGNIMGGITATPRVTYSLGRDGMLPAWFGRISRRFHTPYASILFMGLLTALLAVTGSFVWLAVVSTLARMIVYAASVAALPATRRRFGGEARFGGRLATLLSVGAALAVCIWAALQSQSQAWITLGALAVLGSLLYLFARLLRGDEDMAEDQAGSISADTVSSIQPPPNTRSPS
jgi:amino acid transporter